MRGTSVGLALAKEVGVELGLGLTESCVRGSFVQVLLAVPADRTLHDVDGLEIEVSDVGIGGILG
jgi:hypothetical protein